MSHKKALILTSLLSLFLGLLFYVFERGYFLSPVMPLFTNVNPTQNNLTNISYSLPSFLHAFAFTLLSIALGLRPGRAIGLWILLGSSYELAQAVHEFGTFDPADMIAVGIGACSAGICGSCSSESRINRRTSLYLHAFWFFTSIATSGSQPIAENCGNNTPPDHKEELPANYIIEAPHPAIDFGETVLFETLLFINEPHLGIHVFDNSDPTNPQAKYFINIPGNLDFVIKDNQLYADNFHDLIVLSLNEELTQLILRLKGIFLADFGRSISTPFMTDTMEHAHDLNTEQALKISASPSSASGGQSAPMSAKCAVTIDPIPNSEARNRLVLGDDRLFLAKNNKLTTLSLLDPKSPTVLTKSEPPYPAADGRIFTYDDGVLLASDQDAVHLYNTRDEDFPLEMGSLPINAECDSVTLNDSKAFIASNEQQGSQCTKSDQTLRIFDLTNLEQPLQLATAALDSPVDIAVSGNRLFICSSVSGLQEYDLSDFADINLNQSVADETCSSLKIFGTVLLASGKSGVTQYDISEGRIDYLSRIVPDEVGPELTEATQNY